MSDTANATITTFKPSGKYYTQGRGLVDESVFMGVFDGASRRKRILELNDGKCPGLINTGSEFIWMVQMDESSDLGWPLLLFPEE